MDKEITVEGNTVSHADGVKCPRCWHWHMADLNFENLCNKCVGIILENFPTHESVAGIMENLKSRGLTPQENPENKPTTNDQLEEQK